MVEKISITVFYPCHNEEDNVEALTQKTLDVVNSISDDFEILIVNDGSKDRTRELSDKLAEKHEQVKAIHHETNKGYGGALQTGFRSATKEWVFYTDGDGQFDIGELPRLLEFIPENDIVTCFRMNRQDSILRKLNGFAWSTLVNMLFKLNLKDIDCAFKLYRRDIFDKIKMHSNGALIDTEILARCRRAGYTMKQIGVKHYPRTAGESSGADLKVIIKAFKELFALRKDILSS